MMWPGCGVLGCFILLTLLCGDAIAAPTLLQQKCPYNQSEWEDRATVVLCQGNDVYHCLPGKDKTSVRELCVERSLVLQGNCPFFTKEGYLHWDPCNETGCPNSSFVSDQVYQYPYCFGNIQENLSDSDDGKTAGWVVPVVVTVVIAVVAIATVLVVYRFCAKKAPDDDTKQRLRVPADESVQNGYSALRKKDAVFIVGLLGNSVSTVGKQIASVFAEKEQMSVKYINYLDLCNGFTFSEKTVYFIDGWYGLWNDNPCEKGEVCKILNLIKLESKQKDKITKFVIGMRSDTKRLMESNGIVSSHRQTILLDSMSEQKESNIDSHLEEIKRKCNRDDCPCKKIPAEAITSNEKIGTHLMLKLLELDHNLGPDMINEKGPLVAMKGHFLSLKSGDERLFAGILYIVLNGFYDENNFKGDIAKQFFIKKSDVRHKDLKTYTKRLEPAEDDFEHKHVIAPMWSAKITGDSDCSADSAVVFWHNFLYISAFHACYEVLDKEKMLLYCNMDAILQLVRPIGQGTFFTVEADINSISPFYEKRIKGSELHDHVKDHPLMSYLREKTEKE
uniref:Uncharacterized protein LOC111132832 n=1 Tax=Crassostrea virginica TaxID=6565 RepID=A0A8B8E6Z6_CRAVI|nr:uncharacterized protein LOC111132832 [Crassostrea virginica]